MLSCKQLIAPTRHRAFILKRRVRSCFLLVISLAVLLDSGTCRDTIAVFSEEGGAGCLTVCVRDLKTQNKKNRNWTTRERCLKLYVCTRKKVFSLKRNCITNTYLCSNVKMCLYSSFLRISYVFTLVHQTIFTKFVNQNLEIRNTMFVFYRFQFLLLHSFCIF